MPSNMPNSAVQQEGKILLAIDALNKNQITSIQDAANAFDVKYSTLKHRVRGRVSRVDSTPNGRKLTTTEESTLVNWVLAADGRGLPPRISTVCEMANLLLSNQLKSAPSIGKKWAQRFINRHKEIKSKYSRRYDYQRALCEDPKIIMDWFQLVQNTIAKYGIVEQDIYNFDETGFSMGMTSTAKVITSQVQSRAKAIQPGNREWVTVIEAIGSTGYLLPPLIIFAGKQHQSTWYQHIPDDWVIGVSENGWTNDKLGELWLKEVFEKHTKMRTIGTHRLLILDGHGSHATAAFDHFCTENHIIPLYLPPHSSHLLQPLDVSCFGPLKRLYGQRVQTAMQLEINHIDKVDFLAAYQQTRPQAFSLSNICSGFAAVGLVPYKPENVLDELHIQVKTSTPPGSSHSKESSSWTAETPKTTRQLQKQSELIKRLWRQRTHSPPSPINQAVEQVVKGAQMAMQNALLLEHEVKQLRAANKTQKRKRDTTRTFIAAGGILTGAEGQQRSQEAADLLAGVVDEGGERPRKRAPPRCSNCHQIGHIRSSCTTR